ncbi:MULTISPECIES: CidA/LrgA family protein [Tatumella]|uniref:CidA/LrgA family protein n=1 Tax=Tatumella punctata TaxID=399969 RepID=A0ABW1VMP3_9GAMM|nr:MULTISPECIES: CidA/LrgA family protein [unclassified Tatumella]MBS0855504.1 CidA/LrgA family protein [Tatumella sp. JGM16]MBS0877114.1 CidA/LrgA family protein [Tatumella sp. JGM82]MBS0890618.1 CidA/LrgA family protein [Tatumella sp. JGM94]MBS0893290.1 CidA/LrgA family protein [Tatumella sp. JGM130]MBS0901417.1 CidA/LrgA family protein [Tatumella sp. JGM100]
MLAALRSQRLTKLPHLLQLPVQVLIYIGLFLFSEQLVVWLHIPLPANIVGMVLMLLLIVSRVLPLKWVKAGSNWLLAEMLLFFVPAVVAVVNYGTLLREDGVRICLVIAISTVMVLAATSFVVEHIYRYETQRAARKQARHE